MPESVRTLVVAARAAGMRADVYLGMRLPGWTRTAAARAIRAGEVCSDLRDLQPSSVLRVGEALTVEVPAFAPTGPPPPLPPVLHADADVLALNKPAGMLCHPVGREFVYGLINVARLAFPDEDLHLGHRLDRFTSGVTVLGRNAEANRTLKAAFKAREVRKTYWAIVRGEPDWDQEEVDAPLGSDEGSPIRIRQAVVEGGSPASTRFRVLARMGETSLVSCRPRTGRTHQIRVHLAFLGFPILGDRIYGQPPEVFISLFEGQPLSAFRDQLVHPRHCLHARALHLPHPAGGALHLHAPLPPDFAWLLRNCSD